MTTATTNDLARTRKRFGLGMTGLVAAGAAWLALPGLPVFWAPRADAATKTAGLALFEHEWQPHDPIASGDGLGPVFNARSCVACHFQGGVGGGGGNDRNVRAFEAMPTGPDQGVRSGLIHAFAVENRFLEGSDLLRKRFPVLPGAIRIVGGCQIFVQDFDPLRSESVNSTALFGAGWVDRISPRSITHQSLSRSLDSIGRELSGDFRGMPAGRYRVLPDGRVGKFGWKAQFATLEEFVAAACANEIGLGNPTMVQAKPMGCGDYPDVEPDLNSEQFRQLVAFVDTLPRPESPTTPTDEERRGERAFASVGCAICHTPDMGGVAGIYSDFLLHSLTNPETGGGGYSKAFNLAEFPPPADHPKPDEWKTPPLWGVADSAPYLHDGKAASLEGAILEHQGDAAPVLAAYRALPDDDRSALIAFLKGLKAPNDVKKPDPQAIASLVPKTKPARRSSRSE
jgi:CxxC motif-containing protein (DUF1111 family)